MWSSRRYDDVPAHTEVDVAAVKRVRKERGEYSPSPVRVQSSTAGGFDGFQAHASEYRGKPETPAGYVEEEDVAKPQEVLVTAYEHMGGAAQESPPKLEA